MKNYIIALLLVMCLVMSSFIYRSNNRRLLDGFFEMDMMKKEKARDCFYLLLFFSKNNCESCLEIVEVLNRLPDRFRVVGLVPEKDLENEEELRQISRAEFILIGLKKFKKYIPPFAPTLYGVSRGKKIFFILPSVPYEKAYFKQFLEEFYYKAYPLLISN